MRLLFSKGQSVNASLWTAASRFLVKNHNNGRASRDRIVLDDNKTGRLRNLGYLR